MSDLGIGPLERDHQLDAFDSGGEELDRWLRRFARIAGGAGTAKTYVGARAMLVQARDERAAGFCERLGFTRSLTDALHLVVLIEDLRRAFG